MRALSWSIFLFAIWMILTANFELVNLFVGFGVSFSIALLYIKMFQDEKIEMINPYYLFLYILVLIKNLVLSNLQMAKRTLSPDMKLNPAIVAVKTKLTSEWKILLLANSITLTPGTLTLDVKDYTLYIHIIECKDIKEKQNITQEFENIISKI
ncbi:MAG: multicomponent Na+:H+ antiporter subunit E [Sulfurimonas sp.]|jgi:multicomponent Na+:H+ antiporter subunit E|uniref:Na+/H+ antiporter subunit E n=1 Tax=Sulfurimonas sp. TaxID=2022749 RepID=UPI0039E559E6